MFENFQPLGSHILVKIVKKELKSSGGIFLAASEQDQGGEYGTVLAKGPGSYTSAGKLIPINVDIDDEIFVRSFQGIPVGEGHLRIISEADILGKFKL